MRCPKCGYISFDSDENCGKCGRDLRETATAVGGTVSREFPPEFLAAALAPRTAETGPEIEAETEEYAADDGFELTEEDAGGDSDDDQSGHRQAALHLLGEVDLDTDDAGDEFELSPEPAAETYDLDAEPSADTLDLGLEPAGGGIEMKAEEPSADTLDLGLEPAGGGIEMKAEEPSADTLDLGLEPADSGIEATAEEPAADSSSVAAVEDLEWDDQTDLADLGASGGAPSSGGIGDSRIDPDDLTDLIDLVYGGKQETATEGEVDNLADLDDVTDLMEESARASPSPAPAGAAAGLKLELEGDNQKSK